MPIPTGAGGATELPVIEAIPALRDALRTSGGRAVLVAPPGAGKTTIVPLALLDEPWASAGSILVLEPRRLATRAAARRMAHLLGEEVGDTVGYQTRDERRIGPTTRVEVLTEGVLTRRLQNDPELPGVAAVIFDEVHERNLPTDIGLAFALDAAATVRPDLRLLAMSATADTVRLSAALGGAAVISSEGRTHPVELRWMPRAPRDRLEPAVVEAVRRAIAEETGDLLVFLPGIGEITRIGNLLRDVVPPTVDIRPLAGALGLAEQDAALAPSPAGRRRVVLATDIAETSLTVEGVRVVIDSGLARAPRFDVRTGMSRLTTITTSRSSAEQRAGRAGRVEPGVCYRLWSKVEHGTRPTHPAAEITEVDLAGFALEIAAWGTPVEELTLLDAPPAPALRAARALLADLGALDPEGRLTTIGRSMLGLPVHPRLARMITARPDTLSCVVAAIVDERDVFRGRPDDLPADLALRVQVVCGHLRDDRADRRAADRLRDRAADIARRARVRFDPATVDPDRAGAALLLAFPDRLAARRRPGQFQLRTGAGAWLPPTDPLAHEPFLVAADLDGKRDRARIRLAAAIDPEEVAALAGDEVQTSERLLWDTARDDLVVEVDRRLGSLRLGTVVRRPAPGEATTTALLARVATTRLAVLGWSAASISLRERVAFLHRHVGDPWPDWSAATLLATLPDWLGPYLPGATGRADLESVDLTVVLRSQLPWPAGAELDRLAPEHLDLPTGRRVRIDYADDRPSVSVRVQDLFGVTEHPTAGGLPLTISLLSPADRPIQITADLPGFWAGSWSEVRKEMAGRYPKHHWPADPAAAPPTRRKDR